MKLTAFLLASFFVTAAITKYIFSRLKITNKIKKSLSIEKKKSVIIRVIAFLISAGIVLVVPNTYYLPIGILLGLMCGIVVSLTDNLE